MRTFIAHLGFFLLTLLSLLCAVGMGYALIDIGAEGTDPGYAWTWVDYVLWVIMTVMVMLFFAACIVGVWGSIMEWVDQIHTMNTQRYHQDRDFYMWHGRAYSYGYHEYFPFYNTYTQETGL